jgi:hypothetical protein
LRAAEEICARKVRVDADFSTPQTAEEPFRPIRAGTIQRTGLLVVGPFDFDTLMQLPISVHHSPPGNTAVNNGGSLAFRTETAGTGFPAWSAFTAVYVDTSTILVSFLRFPMLG